MRRKQALDAGPVELETDESPARAARRLLVLQRSTPDEIGGLVEVDESSEPDLER